MMTEEAAPTTDRSSLGERIRELRLRRRWSQQDLAERVGVRQKQISSYERDINNPSSEILIALANAFDVSLDYLAQRTPGESTQVTVADRELLEKVQQLDKLADEDRAMVKRLMDLLILKRRFQALAGSEGL